MMNNEIIHIVNGCFGLQASENNFEELLSAKINHLIVNDFNRLIQILYRADISEKKLKQLLEENKTEDAGKLIGALFIERQLQKIKSRRENRQDLNDITDEERW